MTTVQKYVGRGSSATSPKKVYPPLSASSPRNLLQRTKMPISVRFRLRPPLPGETYTSPHPLQVTVTVEGRDPFTLGAVWPLDSTAAKLLVNPEDWQVGTQCSTKRTDPVNRSITALKAHIEAIYDRQIVSGAKPESKSIKRELVYGVPPVWDGRGWDYDSQRSARGLSGDSLLTDIHAAYIVYLRSKDGTASALSPITLGRWERSLFLLSTFQKESDGLTPALTKVSIGWAKRYHGWLQTVKPGKHNINPIGTEQATRFLWKLSDVLQWAYEESWITANPIAGVKWPRSTSKEVHFLEPHHVRQLMQTQWSGTESVALWWFSLMCCTGLDYPDAVGYARNRKAYEVDGPGGRRIVGNRLKPPCIEYHIPLLDEVDRLFSVYPTGPFDYTAQCTNRHTGRIEQLLGIDWRITNKTARKTFGCMMLDAGYSIHEVSRMLGHSSIQTTEKYYVKVSGLAVDRAMQRVKGAGLAVDRSMLRIAMPTIEQVSRPFIKPV